MDGVCGVLLVFFQEPQTTADEGPRAAQAPPASLLPAQHNLKALEFG